MTELGAILTAALGIGGGLVVVSAAAAWSLRDRIRARLLEREAERCGLRAPADGTSEELFQRFESHPLLGMKSARTRHTVRGELRSRPLLLAEHAYEVRIDNRRRQVRHRVAIVELEARWPTVSVRSQRSRRFARSEKGQRLLLDDRAFNSRFMVTGDDPDFAILLLDPRVQAAMTARQARGWWWFGDSAIAFVQQGPLRASDLTRLPETVESVISSLAPGLRAEAGWPLGG